MSRFTNNSVTHDENSSDVSINQSASVRISSSGAGDESCIAVSVANNEGEVSATGRGDSVSVEVSNDEPPVIVIDDEEVIPTDAGSDGEDRGGHGSRVDRDHADTRWNEQDEQQQAESPDTDSVDFDFSNFGHGHMTQSVVVSNALDLFWS